MIGVIAAVIGGLITGLKTPLLSPVIYLSKFRKDLFLILFFVYCLALGYELEITNIYNANLITIFAVILPSVSLLDAGLRGESRGLVSYILVVAILIGWFVKEIFIIAVLIALFYHFSKDYPKRGVFVVLVSISLLTVGLVFGKSILNMLGGSSTQVVFISAISILIVLLFWRKFRKTELAF
ncbi:hypothetical protein DRP04_05755 [Archaeoglobales archaeon]|nr:MAG: hypothetical protein DRP04_05755 [Archaeoglobales archaeon]